MNNSYMFLMKSIMMSVLGASVPAILFYFALWTLCKIFY